MVAMEQENETIKDAVLWVDKHGCYAVGQRTCTECKKQIDKLGILHISWHKKISTLQHYCSKDCMHNHRKNIIGRKLEEFREYVIIREINAKMRPFFPVPPSVVSTRTLTSDIAGIDAKCGIATTDDKTRYAGRVQGCWVGDDGQMPQIGKKVDDNILTHDEADLIISATTCVEDEEDKKRLEVEG